MDRVSKSTPPRTSESVPVSSDAHDKPTINRTKPTVQVTVSHTICRMAARLRGSLSVSILAIDILPGSNNLAVRGKMLTPTHTSCQIWCRQGWRG